MQYIVWAFVFIEAYLDGGYKKDFFAVEILKERQSVSGNENTIC